MDYYTRYIHDLADDFTADMNGKFRFIVGDEIMYLPHTNVDKFIKFCSNLGIHCTKKYCCTYIITSCPENFRFKDEDLKKIREILLGKGESLLRRLSLFIF